MTTMLPELPVQDGVKFAYIPTFVGYCAGDDGSIWSCWQQGRWRKIVMRWHRLKPRKIGKGYLAVWISNGVVSFNQYVHYLILITFVGHRPIGMECRHLDDNRNNNNAYNLLWGTSIENKADAYANGKSKVGEDHHLAKMTEEQVLDAIELRKTNRKFWSYQRLADKYGVTLGAVHAAVTGRNWKHLHKV